jgi:hypothetical protein
MAALGFSGGAKNWSSAYRSFRERPKNFIALPVLAASIARRSNDGRAWALLHRFSARLAQIRRRCYIAA